MTGNGKIARLPNDIRTQVNRRLHDGQHLKRIASWLNSLPEVKALIASDFGNHPICHQNLSQWKKHGFQDWLAAQQALDFVHALEDQSSLGHKELASHIPDKLAHFVALQYAIQAKSILNSEVKPHSKWLRLRELCADACKLRKGDLLADRLSIEREWLTLGTDKAKQAELDSLGMSAATQREIEEEFGLTAFIRKRQNQSNKSIEADPMSSTGIPVHTGANQIIPENPE